MRPHQLRDKQVLPLPLGITKLLTDDYIHELLDEAAGHPYVIKVLLGEVAKAQRLPKIERIIASQDDILDALFERTYVGLSPVAKRVFLTLCSWRSTVPMLALEAVLVRPTNDRMNVRDAVEELERSSFVEVTSSSQDEELFMSVPLVATIFGQRKLAVSAMKSAIDADVELLIEFGAAKNSDVYRGVAPRVERVFRNIARRILRGGETFDTHLPMLEFIARQYHLAWLLIADLALEVDPLTGRLQAKAALQRYLEIAKDPQSQYDAWKRLADLNRITGDYLSEVHALVAQIEAVDMGLFDASYAANRITTLLRDQKWSPDTSEKIVLLRRLAVIMDERMDEANATDYSRLAWLYIHLRDTDRAQKIVALGLERDPYNEHCQNLSYRLSKS